jgi:hypothetical protein
METQSLSLSPFQHRVLTIPEEIDIFLGGGRGGGKSFTLALLALRHAEQYGPRAHILYLRKTYAGLRDFELLTRELFAKIYGTAARFNAAEHIWRLPGGATLELGQLETHSDWAKYQGRSQTLILCDEAGQYDSPDLLDLLRSNLRSQKGIPLRMIISANPGGVGHHWLAQRYVFKAAPWTPFYEERSKRTFVHAPSTFVENTFIDQAQYRAQLESSAPHDPELLKAWLEGSWTIARGAFFSSVIDEARNAIDPAKWQTIPDNQGWRWDHWLAHDAGFSAPSVTYVMLQSPGAQGPDGRYYPRDSIVIVDELATNQRGRLNAGLGWTVPILAEEIQTMCRRWRIAPRGVADDACFANMGYATGSIADEFRRSGVSFYPARKADRISGWQTMRTLLSNAGKPDVPGLYISRAAEYFWQTVPYLARDERRTEDVDTKGPDHAADACRYGVLRMRDQAMAFPLAGF